MDGAADAFPLRTNPAASFMAGPSLGWPAPMIDVQGLTKVYTRARGNGARALDGATFTVPDRSIFGFLGPNGAGKTTTIRILATILEPTEGTATIEGHDIRTEPLAVKVAIGYMPEYPGYYPTMTAEQHLDYWGQFYHMSKEERANRGKELLDLVGLGEERAKKVKAYSHGMLKRLGLAQALLHDPPVLILDEPAGGLDP
jgi:ABC-2 type transport system ATP-binding protein